jgi:polyisoprenoid-binding protein YceI
MSKNLYLPLILLVALAAYFAPASESQAEASSYKIDPVHSSIHFRIKHMGVGHVWGRFNKLGGEITFADGGKGSSVSVEVETGSVDTGNGGRDKHLKSPDFFSAGEFPSITFKSTAWKKTGEGSYEVTGDLMLHGQTKSVTAKVTKVGEGDLGKPFGYRIGFDGELTINRSDFGMTKPVGDGSDEVTLYLAFEAMRQ